MTELLHNPKIKPEHLARKAIVYLRQSSERQVRQNKDQRLAFTATAVSPGIVRALIDDCRIEPAHSGIRVTYTTYLEPVSVFRPLMGLMKGPMGKQLDKAMRALATRAEGR